MPVLKVNMSSKNILGVFHQAIALLWETLGTQCQPAAWKEADCGCPSASKLPTTFMAVSGSQYYWLFASLHCQNILHLCPWPCLWLSLGLAVTSHSHGYFYRCCWAWLLPAMSDHPFAWAATTPAISMDS